MGVTKILILNMIIALFLAITVNAKDDDKILNSSIHPTISQSSNKQLSNLRKISKKSIKTVKTPKSKKSSHFVISYLFTDNPNAPSVQRPQNNINWPKFK
jgi:hypothetical protein